MSHTGHMRICPTCNGTGINPVVCTVLCPKCRGEKAVPWGLTPWPCYPPQGPGGKYTY